MTPDRAPFRLLYNNDCTNLLNCASPFNRPGDGFHPRQIEAAVDEIAGTGVDASLLSPGLGWVPWWPSEVDRDHYAWYEKQTGEPLLPGGFEHFVRHGGDVVKPFVDRCRRHGIAPFATFRLNDAHFVGRSILDAHKPRFYLEHPEYRLSPGGPQDWTIPEVRQYKVDLISELLDSHDLAGIELDFLRHWWFFNTETTSSDERKACMRDFVSKVRSALDRTARAGERRWLCVRVPIFLSKHDAIGIDLPGWVNDGGVEMVNLSASFLTHQDGDLARIREMIPLATIYQECNHCTMTATLPHRDREHLDQFHYRRTTDEEFYSSALLAYEQGADGISLFNFVYYREHGPTGRGTFCEPPFHVLNHLADEQWLADRPERYYFLGSTTNDRQAVDFQLPYAISSDEPQTLKMRMCSPDNPQGLYLCCRVHTKQPSADLSWSVRLNGAELERADIDGEPFEQPYDDLLGEAGQRTGWTGPASAVRAGDNEIQITLGSGGPVDITRVDIVLVPRC